MEDATTTVIDRVVAATMDAEDRDIRHDIRNAFDLMAPQHFKSEWRIQFLKRESAKRRCYKVQRANGTHNAHPYRGPCTVMLSDCPKCGPKRFTKCYCDLLPIVDSRESSDR